MQIQVTLEPVRPIEIPMAYHYAVQSAIYGKLAEIGASEFWHESGYGEENTYTGFVFGSLSGTHQTVGQNIIFYDRIFLEVRSPSPDFCQLLSQSFSQNPSIILWQENIPVTSMKLCDREMLAESMEVFCVSPVLSVYSGAGRKKLCHSPSEEAFVPFLLRNYERKYEAICRGKAPALSIVPLGEHKKMVTKYKGMWLTAYSGRYRLSGEKEALKFVYNAGLGSKNAQGFGMIELISR